MIWRCTFETEQEEYDNSVAAIRKAWKLNDAGAMEALFRERSLALRRFCTVRDNDGERKITSVDLHPRPIPIHPDHPL